MDAVISHRDATEAGTKRDHTDLEKIQETLSICMLFSSNSSLRNSLTGVVAKQGVNVHESESVGTAIIEKMTGKPVFGTSFKRKDRARTIADQSAIKVAKDRVIQPYLPFQIFVVVSKSGSLEELMSYDLSPFHQLCLKKTKSFAKPTNPT